MELDPHYAKPGRAELPRERAEHDRELDELIAAGWGNVEQPQIPKDWRTRKPPATSGEERV